MTTPTPTPTQPAAVPEALLPCPFCNGAAHFESDADGWHWIECESCGMQGNRAASLMEDCRPKLAEQWNRRAHPDVQSGYADGWQDGMSEATSLLAGSAEPAAYLVPRSAFRCSPHGQDAESHEWLEVTEDPSEKDAFPVFAAPLQAPLKDEREAFTAWFDRRDGVRNAWTAWQARAAISQSNAEAPTPTQPAAAVPEAPHWPQLRSALAMFLLGWARRHPDEQTMDRACESLDFITAPRMPLALLRSAPDWREAAPAPTTEQAVAGVRAALAKLEHAIEAVCALRTQEQYLSMIDSGQQPALEALDDARRAARSILAAPGGEAPAAAVLAHLDALKDDAAAHIYPSDLQRCMTRECCVEVASVRMGRPGERSVPLFSRQQVVDALLAAQSQKGAA